MLRFVFKEKTRRGQNGDQHQHHVNLGGDDAGGEEGNDHNERAADARIPHIRDVVQVWVKVIVINLHIFNTILA